MLNVKVLNFNELLEKIGISEVGKLLSIYMYISRRLKLTKNELPHSSLLPMLLSDGHDRVKLFRDLTQIKEFTWTSWDFTRQGIRPQSPPYTVRILHNLCHSSRSPPPHTQTAFPGSAFCGFPDY